MSKLIKKLNVPENARKNRIMCPDALNIYEDRVESVGGQGKTWFFRDYIGIDLAVASLHCAFSGVRFLTSANAGRLPTNGAAMLSDNNRVNFCSGTFSYKDANAFAKTAYIEIKKAFEDYKINSDKPAEPNPSTLSSMDEIKKLKELLDIGAVTQEEFDAKKKQLLGL